MQKNPVGWIEVPVTDIDRAEKFYADYFGFKMERKPDSMGFKVCWFPMDEGYGAAGMLIQGEGCIPSHEGATLYFTAPNGGTVEDGVKKAEAMGQKILVPKTDIGEHGFFASIEDSEGNKIAIHSMAG